MASWRVAFIWIARSSWAGFAAILVGSLLACAPPSAPTREPAPGPRAAGAGVIAEAASPLPRSDSGTLEHEARFADVPCWFRVTSHRQIDCGQLIVPENWSKPESKLIHLPVVIFRAAAAQKEPIVFLNGGPGGRSRIRTADEIRVWLGLLRSQTWTWQRDFVVIAQRGTNWSDSNLGCPALTRLWRRIDAIGRSDPAWRSEVESATVACAQGLAQA
jgi:hypothetical protein